MHIEDSDSSKSAESPVHQRFETDLRDSEARMRAVVDTAVDAIITIDERGQVDSVNRAAERLFGYTAEELQGHNVNKLMPSPYREEHNLYIQNYLTTGLKKIIGIGREVVGQRKDGTLFPMELAVSEVRLSGGVRLFTGFVRDITERKLAERRMGAQYAVTRILAESATLGEATSGLLQAICEVFDGDVAAIWRVELQSRLLVYGQSWQSESKAVEEFNALHRNRTYTLGVGLGALWQIAKPLWSANLAQEPAFSRPELVTRWGLHAWLGFPLLSGDRVLGVIEVFSRRVQQPDEDLLRLMTSIGSQIGQFIERRSAEEDLAEERERLAVTLRSIGDGVITVDSAGRVLLMSRIAEKLTGWSQAEARRRPLAEVLHILSSKPHQALVDPVQWLLGHEGVAEIARDAVLIAKDGVQRRIDGIFAPLHDRGSVRIGVVVAFRDMTERQRMEQELLKADKLESIGLLAGGIAHDFNNFLSEIVVNLSLAKMSLEPEQEAYSILSEAEKASMRAKDLTQQLLTFSKGGAPIKKLTNLQGLLRDTVRFASSGSKVRCQFQLPECLWPAEVDPGQIGQVVNNLVLNALQAMPAGGTLTIQAENVVLEAENRYALPSGRYVKFSLTDQGVGIPPEHLDRIFEPYFTTKREGTGLGLATSYSILKRHEGHIHAESGLGRGTTFHLLLPAQATEAPARLEKAQRSLEGKGRILLMEDSDGLRMATLKILARLGYQAEGVHDGMSAIELYQKFAASGHPFDVVIMDLTIPGGMGGKETIQRLRELDPQVRAIAASGYSTDPILANFRDYGFAGVMAKPFSRDELAEVLEAVLANGA